MTEKESYSSFFERALAKIIDSLFYLMLFLLPIAVISASTEFRSLLDNILNFSLFIIFLGVLVLPFEIFMTSKFKGTPGKLIMGLKIQKEDGKALTYKEAFIRLTIGRAVSGLFFGLGYLWIFRSKKKQAWHDLINETVVIKYLTFGWLIGILILIVFVMVNLTFFAGIIVKILSNAQFYQSLIS